MESVGRALIVVENNSVPFDRRVWREAKTLQAAQWDVTVICPQDRTSDRLVFPAATDDIFEVIEDIKIYRFPLTFAKGGLLSYIREYLISFFYILRYTWSLHTGEGFDVIQFCNPPDIFFPLGFLFRLRGKGVIFDHHDLFPEGVSYRYEGLRGRALYHVALLMEYLTFQAAHVVMSTNESYRQIALQRGRKTPEHVIVVRNGPELASFEPVDPENSLKDGRKYLVCYLGVMGAEDGVEVMLDAIKFVVKEVKRDDILFVLIGDGALRGYGLKFIEKEDLQDSVLLPGRLSEGRVKRYLSTADVCLSPDPFTPLNDLSTMNKIMEYMVMAKPLVSFDLKEARLSAGSSALYVECGDSEGFGQAIVDLIDNPAKRSKMGRIGRQRVLEKLGWEHQSAALLEAYAKATSLGLGAV